MRKLLISLGAITSFVAPIVAVVSCDDDSKPATQGASDSGSNTVDTTTTGATPAANTGSQTTTGATPAANTGSQIPTPATTGSGETPTTNTGSQTTKPATTSADKTITIANKDALIDLADDKGYTLNLGANSEIAKLFSKSVDVIVKEAALEGDAKDVEKIHGTGDFAILVKGTPVDKKTTEMPASGQFKDGNLNYLEVNTPFPWSSFKGGAHPASVGNSSLHERWGINAAELKNVSYIIYLQQDGESTPNVKLTEQKIAQFKDDKIGAADITVAATDTLAL